MARKQDWNEALATVRKDESIYSSSMNTSRATAWDTALTDVRATKQKPVQPAQQAKPAQAKKAELPRVGMGDLRAADVIAPAPENPTVGENLFLTNILPIKKQDSPLKKLGKGAVNVAGSVLSAPGEALRQTSILGGNLLTGKGVPNTPKNTSFVEDILPKGASASIGKLEQTHPVLGGVARMGLETAADPVNYLGAIPAVGAGLSKVPGAGLTRSIKTAELPRVETPRPIEPQAPGRNTPHFEGEIPIAIRDGKPVYAREGILEPNNANVKPPVSGEGTRLGVNALVPIKNATEGQKPANAFTVQKGQPIGEIPEGMTERGVSRNIRTDTARPDELRDAISENPMAYNQKGNQETLAKAQAIYDEGLEPAVTKLNELLKDMQPEAAPLVKLIADDLTKMGQVDRARELLSEAAVRATEAGQFGQAFRILREADAQTFLMTMDKQLVKLNEQGQKLYPKKWTNIDLTDAEKAEIARLPKGDQVAYDALMNRIGERIANILPSSGLEKFDAWRRTAMLLNPKTHIRNIVGNMSMSIRKVADTIAVGLEKKYVPVGQRTKSVGWRSDKNMVDVVNRDWEAISREFAGEKVNLNNLTKNLPSFGRYEIDNLKFLNREKRVFKNNVLEGMNNLSRNTLNAEDYFFKERAYKDALGGFLKANKLTEVTDAAREYAKRRALEATFQDANWAATFISRAKSSPGPGGKVFEAAIPFVKTPTNIVKRALEYSPAGLLRLLSGETLKDPAMVVEILAQGITGSGIAALGFMLANMGWLRGKRSTSKNAEGLMQAAGEQSYSLVTPLGSFTLDWLQPIAVPLFMGVSVQESIEKQGKFDPDTVAKALAEGGDTIFNLSMLQNIKDLLGGGFGSPTEAIGALPASYLQQAFPTVGGQFARTIDDTRRTTYDTTKMGRFEGQIAAKTPFASKTLEPRLDIWGNEQQQGGAFQQFINPGYVLPRSDDATTQEVLRLHRSTGETDFLPKLFSGSFTSGGVKYELTPEQLTAFQRGMGQKNHKDISQVMQSPFYSHLSDEEKADRIARIVSKNYDLEKNAFLKEQKKAAQN